MTSARLTTTTTIFAWRTRERAMRPEPPRRSPVRIVRPWARLGWTTVSQIYKGHGEKKGVVATEASRRTEKAGRAASRKFAARDRARGLRAAAPPIPNRRVNSNT